MGSHIVVDYLRKGETVRALYRSEGRKEIIRRLLDYYCADEAANLFERIDWFKGDILNLSDLKDAFVGVDRVVHCAALVSFQKRDFYKLWEVNREGTANMVNLALDSDVKHFVHVSSTAAVGTDGQNPDGFKRETNHWNANEIASTYSYTKYSAEKEVWRGVEEGLNAVIVNPSVMFGPGSWNESSLTIFRTIANGFNYYSIGGNAFVDVRDVSKVILNLQSEGAVNERYLVTGHNKSFKELFDLMSVYMKRKAPHKKATPFLTYLAWIASGIKSFFSGTDPALTKDSIRSAMGTTRFSTEKLFQKYPEFKFTPLEETIQETITGRMD